MGRIDLGPADVCRPTSGVVDLIPFLSGRLNSFLSPSLSPQRILIRIHLRVLKAREIQAWLVRSSIQTILPFERSVSSRESWSDGWLVGWSVGWLVCLLFFWSFCWFVGRSMLYSCVCILFKVTFHLLSIGIKMVKRELDTTKEEGKK